MKKLRTKIFAVIFGSLSLCLFSFILIFNIQNYNNHQNFINNQLRAPFTSQVRIEDQPYTTSPPGPNSTVTINESPSENYIQNLINRTNESFSASIIFSILLFIALESALFFISRALTDWVSRPVEETLEKQKQFIADTSHELKTPLSVILASSEALENAPTETKWLTNIKTEANHMNILITDLLALSSSDRLETRPLKKQNLSKIVELTTLAFEGKAFEKNLKLKTKIAPNIIINLDQSSIKQLVEILLDNAITHATKNSTIEINLEKNNKSVILSVKNRGEPIPKDEEEKIFDRFYRVDKSRSRKNNHYGLGLAIAKNIAELHNAKISAHSEHKITTFTVTFTKSR